jgi:acetylornithine deacetylase/succinyl-diaminopimelate desuccinylase-like protein
MTRKYFFTFSLLFAVLTRLCFIAEAQAPRDSLLQALAQRHANVSWDEFRDLLSLPNDAHYPADIEANVQWCERAFTRRGFQLARLSTPTLPLLLAERRSKAPADKTVLMYVHLDGQPVDPSKWRQASPWTPALKALDEEGQWREIPWERLYTGFDPEWRIFARSASDDKGPVSMLLAALDALAEIDVEPNYHIKVIMDFEEEIGSPQLPAAVEKYREALFADLMIILDGPRHVSNLPTLSFGARGIAAATLTIFGPRTAQHSGHFGNYAPNPAMRLAHLLASMKDEDGRVTIPGWYDGVRLDDAVRDILARVPDDEVLIRHNIGIAEAEKVGANYQEALQYPSLNVRGMASGWVGDEVRTIVPAEAAAELDIRLVPESDPERLLRLLRAHIEAQGYHLVESEPTEEERRRYPRIASLRTNVSYQAFRTDFDTQAGQWLERAMYRAFQREPVKIRISGGSVPISPFVKTLGIPAVTVPTVNRDNNQHGPNENIRLGNYVEGVKTLIAILTEPL